MSSRRATPPSSFPSAARAQRGARGPLQAHAVRADAGPAPGEIACPREEGGTRVAASVGMATPNIRTILAPIDFEPASLAALERAVALATHLGARVVPLHVHMSPDPNPGIAERLMEKHREAVRDAAASATAQVQKRWGLAVQHREGEPASAILRAIEDLDVDLVAMGTHGRRGAGRLLCGSVAEKVVRKSEVPVLLVRQACPAPAQPVVLCATDLGRGSRTVIERARQLADAAGARLDLLHAYAVALGSYPSFDPGLVARAVEEIERWATVELAAAARDAGAARRYLVVGGAAAAILETAHQLNPLFVVVGTHRRHGVARLYMGSVAEWVLRRSPYPVLIVPVGESADPPDVAASARRALGVPIL
jgi:nucleotide-binding universal stress UspA family protein